MTYRRLHPVLHPSRLQTWAAADLVFFLDTGNHRLAVTKSALMIDRPARGVYQLEEGIPQKTLKLASKKTSRYFGGLYIASYSPLN